MIWNQNRDLYEKIIPYTGWNPSGAFEFFPFYFIILTLSVKEDNKKTINSLLRVYIIIMLGFMLSDGIEDWLSISPEDYTSTNPYLRYDALTPIYTIALPLFWILVMVGALLNSFLKKRSQNRSIQTT